MPTYGPYHVGDFVQCYNPEQIFGIVTKAGSKVFIVTWEDGKTQQLLQDYPLLRAEFRNVSVNERSKIIQRIRKAQKTPVYDGLCSKGVHGLDFAGQSCDLCAKGF